MRHKAAEPGGAVCPALRIIASEDKPELVLAAPSPNLPEQVAALESSLTPADGSRRWPGGCTGFCRSFVPV